MAGTRRSTRQSTQASSQGSSPHSKANGTEATSTNRTKRKASETDTRDAEGKRARLNGETKQTTLDAAVATTKSHDDSNREKIEVDDEDKVDSADKDEDQTLSKQKDDSPREDPKKNGASPGPEDARSPDSDADADGSETARRVQEKSKEQVKTEPKDMKAKTDSAQDDANGSSSRSKERQELKAESHDQARSAEQDSKSKDDVGPDDESKKEKDDPSDSIDDRNHEASKEPDQKGKTNGFELIMNADEKPGNNIPAPENTGSKVAAEDDAVEHSTEREQKAPSSILEKGIIYFFFRGRVGMDEPDKVADVARSYIVLRPLPHGAKIGEGPIGDAGQNRILALPKKVLPVSPKDRFLCFVERAKCSMDDIKEQLSSSDYATKTVGNRHTPAAAPIGEGVYAITQTGRNTHLAYKLTIPEKVDDVQKGMGLQQQGSYLTSAKNPESSAPANAQLPQTANYPKEIQDEFAGRGWMSLQPRHLDFEFTQFLLIGHKEHALEKAAQPQDDDDKNDDKETPLEEIEKLGQEDEARVEQLAGDHAVFVDLGLSSREYPKMQTTW